MPIQGTAVLLFLAALIAFPLVITNPTYTSIGYWTVLFIMICSGWNIFSGYTGYLALGHAVYYGVGQYFMALMLVHNIVKPGWPSFYLLPVCGVVGMLFALPLGWMTLRVRKHTFIVLCIALMFVFQLCAYNFRGLTGGSSGLYPPGVLWTGNSYNNPFYYAALVGAVLAVATSWVIRRSKYGLNLLAIRDDEDRARSLGINVSRSKLIAFVVSAFFLGVAGGLYPLFQGQVFPQFAFAPFFDVQITVMVFAGGIGTLAGPVIGALVVETAYQYTLTTSVGQNWFLVIYGVMFILILRLLPGGVVTAIARVYRERVSARANVKSKAELADAGPEGVNKDATEVTA